MLATRKRPSVGNTTSTTHINDEDEHRCVRGKSRRKTGRLRYIASTPTARPTPPRLACRGQRGVPPGAAAITQGNQRRRRRPQPYGNGKHRPPAKLSSFKGNTLTQSDSRRRGTYHAAEPANGRNNTSFPGAGKTPAVEMGATRASSQPPTSMYDLRLSHPQPGRPSKRVCGNARTCRLLSAREG